MKILNLGCGHDIYTSDNIDYVNIDIELLDGVNLVHDLNIFPYPFIDESVDVIIMNNILEHLDNPIDVLQECYRILNKDGECRIMVIYWNHKYSYSDPQHKWAFSEKYFDFFIVGRAPYYMKEHFSSLKINYHFDDNAIKKYGNYPDLLLKKAYFHCNIIQGMEVILTK